MDRISVYLKADRICYGSVDPHTLVPRIPGPPDLDDEGDALRVWYIDACHHHGGGGGGGIRHGQ